MSRKPLIAGNWKMHGSVAQTTSLIQNILPGMQSLEHIDILVCPTFLHLQQAKKLIEATPLLLGAQNLYTGTQGAYTGEVSATMLRDIGCTHVIIGHSERRTIFKESLELIAAKCSAALAAHLLPILCVGETQAEREAMQTEAIIESQIQSVIEVVGIAAFNQIIIAYEPVWAIGTGLTATPNQAQTIHAYIRSLIGKNQVDIARTMRILYGGSMKPENAQELLAMPDIDGGLIGGASLDAASFLAICEAAGTCINSYY